MENIFNQACFTKEVWVLCIKIMDLFEEGQLKDQKLSTKSLVTKPEFKQHHFSSIQCLPSDFQIEIFGQVAEGELSLSEIKVRATKYTGSLKVFKEHFASEKTFF